ncbi:HVO_0758 family zinc finger protein [Haloferacaceae archaeon DSL9]
MNSIRNGLRNGDLAKDTYGRLTCDGCERPLKTHNDPAEIFALRTRAGCGPTSTGRLDYRNRNVSRFFGANVRMLNSW